MPDDEDYKFVIQEFDGMTVSFEADSDAVSSAVSDLDPVEAAVFVDFTVIDWTGIAGETLEEHFGSDNCYEETGAIRSEFDTFDISNPAVNTIGQLLAHLKTADYGTDKDIYGNTYNNVYSWFFEMTAAKTITQAQQRAYYQQHLANSQYYNSRVDELEYHDAEDLSDLDDTDQDTMSQFDGYDQVIGNLELDEDNNYIYEGAVGNILIKDFTTAVQFDYTTIDNDSMGVTVVDAGETSIVNDSPTISSTDWSYDYGLSDKLIYDDRVMNDVNTFEVKSYTTSSDSGVDNTLGPVILGEIEYYVNKDTSTTYEYSGKVSDEARYDESHVTSSRNLKSLERELSPVHSFNDESVLFSWDYIINKSGVDEDNEDAFISFLMDLEIIKPSFVRNGSLDGYSDATDDHLTEENKYNLTGFYIGSRFAEVVNDPNEYGEQWVLDTSTGSTSDISNFADQIRSDLKDKWEEVSREEFEGYMTKVENVNFGQYVERVG